MVAGLLAAATAVAAVLFAGERPSGAFWAASGAGLVAVLVFAGAPGAGVPSAADVLVLIAVAFGALGYAKGVPCRASSAAGRPSAGRWCCRCR